MTLDQTARALSPSASPPRLARPLLIVLMALLIADTLAIVALWASGRLEVVDAIVFMAVPWTVLAAALRPDWLLLGLIAIPASFTAVIQTKRVLLLVALALVALLVTRKRFSLGLRTGLVALIILALAGHLFRANVGQDALAVNQGTMLSLAYYVLLALLAFNLAVLGELDAERLGTALVVGVATTLVVGFAGYGGAWFESGPGIVTHTYLAYLTAAAFGVSLVRLLGIDEAAGGGLGDLLMTGVLLSLTILSLVRAAWIAAAVTLALVAFRARKRGYVLLLIAGIVLALLSPMARQQIARSESGDIVAGLRTGEITSGRWKLWSGLWERAEPALPWGNGFGYIWSLSSEDLFGAPGEFGSEQSGIVPPHNDFVYLLVEFGVPGVLLLAFFWVQLFRARSVVTNGADPLHRRSGWLFLGMLITGLVVALVDNVFAVRPFAERFFPVAGFMFGLAQVERARRRERVESESLPKRAPTSPQP